MKTMQLSKAQTIALFEIESRSYTHQSKATIRVLEDLGYIKRDSFIITDIGQAACNRFRYMYYTYGSKNFK